MRISSGNQEMEVVSWSLVRFLRFLWFYSVCRGYRLSHIHMCTQSHVYTYVYKCIYVYICLPGLSSVSHTHVCLGYPLSHVCVFLNRIIMNSPTIITQIVCKILISKYVPKKRTQKLLCIFFCIPFRLYTLAHYRLHVAFLHTFSNIVAIWVKIERLCFERLPSKGASLVFLVYFSN